MLQDQYGRKINYLRVSVTDKCNLRCRYCRPAEGVPLKKHSDILSLEKIYEIVEYFVNAGIDKVRLTGGEPLVRKNVIYLIEKIAALKNLKDIGMTTNGILLAQNAKALYKAGLKRVNISLDTLDPEKFSHLTRGGNLDAVLNGIKVAQNVGFNPIKVNMVLIKGFNEDEQANMTKYCDENNLELRFIKEMNLKKGTRYVVENADVGRCETCNRLRMTCEGKLKPCLFSDYEIDLNKMPIEDALKTALHKKPEYGTSNAGDYMVQIGG
jgi:GTP 3',8-cyclase